MNEKFQIRHSNVAIFKISCAESEKSLYSYYKYNPFFEEAEKMDSLKTFFVGRTGIGKTAIIENLHAKISNNKLSAKVIRITPEDFIFDVAERSEVIKELTNQNINLSLLYKTLWKSILLMTSREFSYHYQD
jgi:predicted ATPase